eukprot:1146914-Pelagomonas_calceolata.AAC.12
MGCALLGAGMAALPAGGRPHAPAPPLPRTPPPLAPSPTFPSASGGRAGSAPPLLPACAEAAWVVGAAPAPASRLARAAPAAAAAAAEPASPGPPPEGPAGRCTRGHRKSSIAVMEASGSMSTTLALYSRSEVSDGWRHMRSLKGCVRAERPEDKLPAPPAWNAAQCSNLLRRKALCVMVN